MKYTKQYQNKDYLYEQHIVQHKSLTEIAELNNISEDMIRYYCEKYEIPIWHSAPKSKLTDEQWEEIIMLYNDGVSTF